MSYQIDRTDQVNNGSITVEDNTVNTDTSLSFVGKGYRGYSKTIGENFLHLLENFASAEAPVNPIPGQLWYNVDTLTDPPQPQLKVWDGIDWVAAGNVKKSTVAPTTAVHGDIWVDTATQQLHIWSGTHWILVGPQFSQGTQSGIKVEQIDDTSNITHLVVSFYVDNELVVVISKDAFTPKRAIEGFDMVQQGINLSDKNFNGDSNVNKIWGTAEKANNLVVDGSTVEANKFLRTDTINTTQFNLNIRHNNGITIGADLNTSLTTTANGEAILQNRTDGSNIFVRMSQGGTTNDILTITGTSIGINKTNPSATLDIDGDAVLSGNLVVDSTDDATNIADGSIATRGGLTVDKSVRIGDDLTVVGTSTTGEILPSATNTHNLGSNAARFNRVFAKDFGNTDNSSKFYGDFIGSFTGAFAGSATKLSSATNISLTGDIESNTIAFDGAQPGGVAVFTTSLSSDVIETKTAITTTNATDELLVNRPGVGLRKVTQSNFFSNVPLMPVGTILPYAGATAPVGYLLCDGSEVLISAYPELFALFGYTYKPAVELQGVATFGLPDLRGRFPLGANTMNGNNSVPLKPTGSTWGNTITSTANRVENDAADTIGASSGDSTKTLDVENLPDHKHDMRGTDSNGNKGTQFYAMKNSPDALTDVDAVNHTRRGPSNTNEGQYLPNSGGILTSGSLGQAVDIMNPFLTVNYIIFTGKIA